MPLWFQRFSLLCSLLIILQSCFPLLPFKMTRMPKAPDYSRSSSWSSLPFKKDSADAVVPGSGMHNAQATAKADVFFIHPTTYPRGTLWNGDLKDTAFTRKTDRLVGRYQASVFNGSCRVYLPRYRVAVFFAYIVRRHGGKMAFEVAYEDIRCAFEYYMEHYNKGRPIIIASHSQGTDHAVRLLQDYFDKDTLMQKKLVTAYLPGGFIYKDTFKNLQPCDTSCSTGCFNTWNSVRWGELTFYGKPTVKPFEAIICVNPLTWKLNDEYAPDSLNKGGVPFGFKSVTPHLADAKCSVVGLLWVHRPKGVSHKQYPQINSPSYHILDYNLFYMNVRDNVAERVEYYYKAQHKK